MAFCDTVLDLRSPRVAKLIGIGSHPNARVEFSFQTGGWLVVKIYHDTELVRLAEFKLLMPKE